MSSSRLKLLLADDHVMLLEAFRKMLEPRYDVVGAVTDGHAMIVAAERLHPDVIIADISMPRLNGLDACQRVKELLPATKLIFLTMNEDPDIASEAIRRGAAGYVLKKSASAELFDALQQVHLGRVYVTPVIACGPTAVFAAAAKKSSRGTRALSLRQREVLQLLAEGRSMKEAADILQVTPRTIAFHKYSIMEQLGLKTGAELIQHAVHLRLVSGRTFPPL
jgi:DNA-binding NarL/FixJ family response regulator